MSSTDLLRQSKSAWIPLVLSSCALLLPIISVLFFGLDGSSQEDEGVLARLFQILLMGQLPIIIYFVLTHAQKFPKSTMRILALQIIGILIPVMLIVFLEGLGN